MITAMLVVVFVISAWNAIDQSREALEYRNLRAASTELELAAHTLAMIEFIEDRPDNINVERADAVEVLEQDIVLEQTGLDDLAQVRASQLTQELTANAVSNGQTEPAEVAELLGLLHADAIRANDRAIAAERSAFQYVLISALSGLAIAGLVLRSQWRERELSRTLRRQAHTDFLTGLPNRRQVPKSSELAKGALLAKPGYAAMLFLDLDGFKDINDTGGHAKGDTVLRMVGDRLLAAQREGETLIRLGGDEFGVIIPDLASPDDAVACAQRYRAALDDTIGDSSLDELIQVSIGVAATNSADQVDDLQVQSNLAMYAAKDQQGSTITVFEERFREASTASSTMLKALRSADYDRELFLEYQPVVAIEDHEVLFVEALLRWNSPTLGMVSPGEFIPLAERSGEILPIGQWVIENSIAQIAAWNEDPDAQSVAVSCNVSIQQFEQDGFIDGLSSAIRAAGDIDPSQLILEVTESSAGGPVVNAKLEQIRSMGHRVAIDDFGSGYSNLAQLVHTPFDILKVDRDLLASLEKLDPDRENASEVLSAVSAIAAAQNAPVVCEGVEHEHQLQPLLESEISHIQGWLIAKAQGADDVQRVISSLDAFPLAA